MRRMSISKATAALFAMACLAAPAFAQQSACIPTGQPAAPAAGRAGRGPGAPPAPRTSAITAIPGVVAADAKWTKIWQAPGNSADGILADKDGTALVAQEDYDAVLKIDINGKTSIAVANAKGIGSLSMDRQGRLYGAHRTERPGSTKPDRDAIVNAITLLTPDRKTVAAKWADGMPLSVRPNDLAADSKGGAFFTSGCLFYADAGGNASVAAEDLRTNGIAFSTDDRILYVTNGASVVAFDVVGTGKLANRREFAKLESGGDGMAVDTDGRVYVTINAGVQVLDRMGASLGVIPTPRGVIQRRVRGTRQEDAVRGGFRRRRCERAADSRGPAADRRDRLYAADAVAGSARPREVGAGLQACAFRAAGNRW